MTYISGAVTIRNQEIFQDGKSLFRGEAPLHTFLTTAYETLQLQYPKFYKMDTLSQLGFLAADVLLKALPVKQHDPYAVSLVLSNAHASQDTDTRYLEASQSAPSPALFVYTLSNIVAGEICIRHGIKGEQAFFVTPQFDAQQIVEYADIVMQQPSTDVCLAGWVDVMGGHHDVFLYLAEKQKRGLALPHSVTELTKLYQQELWNS